MANPIIQSTQVGPGAGTPGQGRNDLLTGVVVNLSDTVVANLGATYLWSFLDRPIGSAATLTGASTSTPSFTPDVEGSYWIQAVVSGAATGSSNEILAVPLAVTGARIPAFGEELQYDGGSNAKGWHESQDFWMRAADALLGGGSGGDTTTVTAVKTAAYTAAFYETVLADPSAGTFTITLPNITSGDIGAIVEVHIDANTGNGVTIDGDGSDTIIGASSFFFTGPYTTARFRAITTSKWAVV